MASNSHAVVRGTATEAECQLTACVLPVRPARRPVNVGLRMQLHDAGCSGSGREESRRPMSCGVVPDIVV